MPLDSNFSVTWGSEASATCVGGQLKSASQPDEARRKQVAWNLIDPWAAVLRVARWLIQDRASWFSEPFGQLLGSAQVEGLRLPADSPNLNASAERLMRTMRQECVWTE